MWALPKAIPTFAGVKLHGKVVYKTGWSVIHPEEVDEIFVKRLGDLMKEACGEADLPNIVYETAQMHEFLLVL